MADEFHYRSIGDAPALFARGAIRGYQLTLSALMGRQCRHLPSCSDYTSEAVGRFGLVGRWMDGLCTDLPLQTGRHLRVRPGSRGRAERRRRPAFLALRPLARAARLRHGCAALGSRHQIDRQRLDATAHVLRHLLQCFEINSCLLRTCVRRRSVGQRLAVQQRADFRSPHAVLAQRSLEHLEVGFRRRRARDILSLPSRMASRPGNCEVADERAGSRQRT